MNRFKRRIRDSSSGPTTFIAPTTKILGNVNGRGPYIFCGTVEGDCDIDGALTLADGGHWIGTLKATDIVVAGKVDGDVIARQRVEIAATAHVNGSLSGNSIAVAEGAVIEGDIKVTTGEEPTAFEEKRQSETVERKAAGTPADDQPGRAESGDRSGGSQGPEAQRQSGTSAGNGGGSEASPDKRDVATSTSSGGRSESAEGKRSPLLGKRYPGISQ